MLLLNQIFKFIKLLNSEKGAWAIASGFALGLILGLAPSNPLVIIAMLFFLFFFRINGAAVFLMWGVMGLLAYLLDRPLESAGYWLLTQPSLQAFFTKLYNMPVVPWSQFNNTLMAGSLFVGCLLFIPVMLLSKWVIERYRTSILVKITNSKPVRIIKSTKL